MNKEQAKGSAKQVKGNIKEKAGKALDNKEWQVEGALEKAAGKVQKNYGDVKDAANE